MLFFVMCIILGIILIKNIFFNFNNRLLMDISNLIIVFFTYIYAILKILQKSDNISNFRDIDYYYYYYGLSSSYKLGEYLQIHPKEYLFWITNYYMGKIPNMTEVDYMVVVFTIISIIYIFSFKWFLNGRYLDLYYFSVIVFSETSNGMINTIRQGFAVSILLLAYMLIVKNHRMSGFLLGISASLFHTSSVIYPVNIIISYIKKVKLLIFWIITVFFLVISITHFNNILFGKWGSNFNDNYENYITLANNYDNSSSMTFPLISIFYGVIMTYFHRFIKQEYKEDSSFLIKCYLLAVCVFLSFSFIAFSDRIAKYAWTMVPFVYIFILDRSIMTDRNKNIMLVLMPIFFIVISFFMKSGSYFV